MQSIFLNKKVGFQKQQNNPRIERGLFLQAKPSKRS